MEKLEVLANVTRLGERVVRILGQNPGKFTLQGTNTHLIGRTNPYILLDAGQGIPEYTPILRSALDKPAHPNLPDVSDIILTHRHGDHTLGLPSVLSLLRDLWTERNPSSAYTPPRLHKYPLPPGTVDDTLSNVVSLLPEGTFTLAPEGAFHDLQAGQTFTPTAPAPSIDPADQTLIILHTPGHTSDSISLLYPADRALFTGDTVLGQGTAVFEDLSAYISSLQHMLSHNRSSRPDDGFDILYPAHGPVVQSGSETINMYITHRLERESQVIDVLRKPPPNGEEAWTVWSIVGHLYAKYPQNLWEPAAHGIGLHLKKLEKESRAKGLGGEGKESKWKLDSEDGDS
ncbi:Metallo-hydrolase/oxidoreductase [Peniophora sp. CONT]|nr:Metallo-hydrolase/oxidoreductase [Peniophora sp. CONT]